MDPAGVPAIQLGGRGAALRFNSAFDRSARVSHMSTPDSLPFTTTRRSFQRERGRDRGPAVFEKREKGPDLFTKQVRAFSYGGAHR